LGLRGGHCPNRIRAKHNHLRISVYAQFKDQPGGRAMGPIAMTYDAAVQSGESWLFLLIVLVIGLAVVLYIGKQIWDSGE